MNFRLKKVIDEDESIKFVEIEDFTDTSYEEVEQILIQRFGKIVARHGTDDSPNTWIRPMNSNEEYILTYSGED